MKVRGMKVTTKEVQKVAQILDYIIDEYKNRAHRKNGTGGHMISG